MLQQLLELVRNSLLRSLLVSGARGSNTASSVSDLTSCHPTGVELVGVQLSNLSCQRRTQATKSGSQRCIGSRTSTDSIGHSRHQARNSSAALSEDGFQLICCSAGLLLLKYLQQLTDIRSLLAGTGIAARLRTSNGCGAAGKVAAAGSIRGCTSLAANRALRTGNSGSLIFQNVLVFGTADGVL